MTYQIDVRIYCPDVAPQAALVLRNDVRVAAELLGAEQTGAGYNLVDRSVDLTLEAEWSDRVGNVVGAVLGVAPQAEITIGRLVG
jgi:hypothetical protein